MRNHIQPYRNAQQQSIFSLFDDFFNGVEFFESLQPPRQIRELVASNFPPANIKVDKEKNYFVELALAGIPEEGIKLDVEGRYVKLSVDAEPADEETRTVQAGIKSFTHLENTYFIPKQWDIDKLEARYKNGLLTIKVPVNEEVKKLDEKKSVKLITE